MLIVEPDPIVRAGWSSVLSTQPWVSGCHAAADGAAAVAAIRTWQIDVALVGLFFDDAHGVEICRRLHDELPVLPVMLVTDAAGLPVRAARAAGASGLVQREWPIDMIVAAVKRATEGLPAFPAPQARAVGGARLSRRERTVLSLLARGASNVEIAGVLHLSPHTVKEYTQTVFRKLGVRNRVEAATAAARLGYAD